MAELKTISNIKNARDEDEYLDEFIDPEKTHKYLGVKTFSNLLDIHEKTEFQENPCGDYKTSDSANMTPQELQNFIKASWQLVRIDGPPVLEQAPSDLDGNIETKNLYEY